MGPVQCVYNSDVRKQRKETFNLKHKEMCTFVAGHLILLVIVPIPVLFPSSTLVLIPSPPPSLLESETSDIYSKCYSPHFHSACCVTCHRQKIVTTFDPVLQSLCGSLSQTNDPRLSFGDVTETKYCTVKIVDSALPLAPFSYQHQPLNKSSK